ncbi:MAG: pantetheine-phosphate adenylyltransferase [Ruminococcaceae bacterium]|nr:pantetheine-phosphate adenylyltransferase [Oscillospiraceae bacterium]MBQ2780638.1 pantetheine-phosphate adenylyltransferase [Clostridia bacterium]MBQ7302949.1 pantetheine-phosphate adenylyltransferase [Clostridia bacterium]
MRIAVCPGSFDPVTLGHVDIIRRAAELFDKVIVVVMPNFSKSPLFSREERMDMIRRVTADIPNVEIDTFDGLLADYTREKNAVAVVKGLRAMSDFEYEFQMALTNRHLNSDLETVFLTTKAEHMYISSSLVKQVAALDGDVSSLIPAAILPEVVKKIREEVAR